MSITNTSKRDLSLLTDYLGNNRAVVRASTGVLDQITHYYPWGGVYADMGTGSALQPFKYGDKELDQSNGVARYDYSARAYVPATLRFDRPDRFASSYPHISPYAFCANNPVNFTDPTGERLICSLDDEEWEYKEGDLGFGFYNSQNQIYEGNDNFIFSLESAFSKLMEGEVGKELVTSLISKEDKVFFKMANFQKGNGYSIEKRTVLWHPEIEMGGDIRKDTPSGPTLIPNVRPPFIGLGHEMAHAYGHIMGYRMGRPWTFSNGDVLPVTENFAVNVENWIRKEHNLPIREYYWKEYNPFLNLIQFHYPDWTTRPLFP